MGGHSKYQLISTHYQADNINAKYGTQTAIDNLLDLRLTAANRWNTWDVQIHYEILTLFGDTPKTRMALADVGLITSDSALLNDEHRLFNLTSELGDSDHLNAVQRLDRLFVGYNGEQLVIRAGRQAVSWGNGLIFHPLDIFSHFAPTEVDKDYKTGDDMLYGQWLFDSGDDVQIILLPRRNPLTDKIETAQSSFALKYRGQYAGQWDFDLLFARHFAENVAGIGLTKNIWEALWRLDISATQLTEGGTAVSLVTNLDYSWVWFKHNFYGYVEYFRNGMGETTNYANPSADLTTRLRRGEVYTLGQDYFAGGVQIEVTPLFNFFSNFISNLHDNSGVVQVRGVYDWSENLQVIGWVDIPNGDKGTEFGGVPIVGGDGYLGFGKKANLQLIYHF